MAVDWPMEPFDPFFNVNRPEDLEAAGAMARAAAGQAAPKCRRARAMSEREGSPASLPRCDLGAEAALPNQMLAPRAVRIVEIKRNRAEKVAGAGGVDDFFRGTLNAGAFDFFAAPHQINAFAPRSRRRRATFFLKKREHLQFRQLQFTAQVHGDNGDIDKLQQIHHARTHRAAVERHHHALLARRLGIVQRRVPHVAIEMQQLGARQIKAGKDWR